MIDICGTVGETLRWEKNFEALLPGMRYRVFWDSTLAQPSAELVKLLSLEVTDMKNFFLSVQDG